MTEKEIMLQKIKTMKEELTRVLGEPQKKESKKRTPPDAIDEKVKDYSKNRK